MKMLCKKGLLVVLILSFLLSGCTTAPKVVADETNDNYRVFYQIFVGSFSFSGYIPSLPQIRMQ